MKTYRGVGSIAPPFLISALEWSALPLGKGHPVPIGWEAGWAPEPVWTLWTTEKILASARN
jgi:hypothetical protein